MFLVNNFGNWKTCSDITVWWSHLSVAFGGRFSNGVCFIVLLPKQSLMISSENVVPCFSKTIQKRKMKVLLSCGSPIATEFVRHIARSESLGALNVAAQTQHVGPVSFSYANPGLICASLDQDHDFLASRADGSSAFSKKAACQKVLGAAGGKDGSAPRLIRRFGGAYTTSTQGGTSASPRSDVSARDACSAVVAALQQLPPLRSPADLCVVLADPQEPASFFRVLRGEELPNSLLLRDFFLRLRQRLGYCYNGEGHTAASSSRRSGRTSGVESTQVRSSSSTVDKDTPQPVAVLLGGNTDRRKYNLTRNPELAARVGSEHTRSTVFPAAYLLLRRRTQWGGDVLLGESSGTIAGGDEDRRVFGELSRRQKRRVDPGGSCRVRQDIRLGDALR